MSEVTLEKNRPFRVDIEKVNFFDKLPDNRDNFEKLKNIFNKTLTFTIAEKSEYDDYHATIQSFLNASLETDSVGEIKPRQVSGVVSGNKLNLNSSVSFNLFKDHYYVVNKEKRLQKKFEEIMKYYQMYEEEKTFTVEFKKLSIMVVNIKTGNICSSPYEHKISAFSFGSNDYAEAIRLTLTSLTDQEVLLRDFDSESEYLYEEIYHIQLFDVEIDFKQVLKCWQEKKLSESDIMKLLSHRRFESIRMELVAFLKSNNISMEDCRVADVNWYKKWLLHCDTERANITPYHENTLLDPNLGHWELYEEALDRDITNTGEESFTSFAYARAPHLDVKETGVCAIDFGTKSTVVACRDIDERLLRIGTGDYTQAPRKEDYENPTTVYFSNIKNFLKNYAQQSGRPYTKWEDLMVSHQAAEHLYDNIDNSTTYYATFSELKQWANDKKRHQVLQDESGKEIELIPYLTIQNRARYIDPIELYAYYLGLYINNMTNGIYLSYILSFPVNYGKDVQEKLLESFKIGLQKSLPPSILEDEELMETFEVYAGASEPAAYAISALEQYKLEPQSEDEEVSYAVFDFGGGTTDFDFGIERKPANQRRKFEIEQFGKGGDPYLGGENLLQLLAYAVYEDNITVLRQEGIQIVLPKKATAFAGSERLVMETDQASQEAHLNMRTLMRLLRPIWEEHKDYKEVFIDGPVSIDLYTKEQGAIKRKPVKLQINLYHLQDVIRTHIQRGVSSFVTQLRSVFAKCEEVQYPVHIFLAGNSCQSRIVQEEFVKSLITVIKGISSQTGKDGFSAFRLYPPLGTSMKMEDILKTLESDEDKELANEIIGINVSCAKESQQMQLDRVRTGKTGVVFGLLRSRRGGKDIKIINNNEVSLGSSGEVENRFPYFLGCEGENRTFEVRINLDIPYNQWRSFDWADEEKFELYYTEDSRALQKHFLLITETKAVICRIDEADEDKMIFIKKTSIDTIEYVVADIDTFTGDTTGMKVYTKALKI